MAHTAWTYRETLRALHDRSTYGRGYVADPFGGVAGAERGLRRTAALLDRLGRPQERYGVVHVAGSKGKGSTSALIAAALRAEGHRVGLYTSPHLHTWRERIAVDEEPVDEATFAVVARRALDAAEAQEAERPELGPVTTFELLTAMGLDRFAEARCGIAVIEVGIGGRYDATNVLRPLVAAITRLDLEHTAILGDTIGEIAADKAGIVKAGRPVVVSPQLPEALVAIAAVASERGSPLLVGGRDWRLAGDWRGFEAVGPWGRWKGLRLGLAGPHQVENAGTALAALWCLDMNGLAVSEAAIRVGYAAARWPGRFERVSGGGSLPVILDGAHTPVAAAALAATFAAEYPGRRATVVLGTADDKDTMALLGALRPVTSAVVATRSTHPRAATAELIAAVAGAVGLPIEVVPAVGEALRRAILRAGSDGVVLVTGSLFVVAEAREALGLARPDPLPRPSESP